MAQTQRGGAPGRRVETAEQEVLRELALPLPTVRAPPPDVLRPLQTAISAAEGRVNDLFRLGPEVDRRVGVSPDRERRREGEQERARAEERAAEVPRVKGYLDVIRGQQLGGLEQHAERIYQTVTEADRLIRAGRREEGLRLYETVRPQVGRLYQLLPIARDIATSGLPEEQQRTLIGGANAAMYFYSQGQAARGDIIMQNLETFSRHRDTLMRPEARLARMTIVATVENLSDRRRSITEENLGRAQRDATQMETTLTQAESERRELAAQAFAHQSESLYTFYGTASPEMRQRIDQAREYLDGLATRLRAGETVTDEELRRGAMLTQAMHLGIGVLDGIESTTEKRQVESVYLAAFDVLLTGGNIDTHSSIMLAAQDITGPRGNAALRRSLSTAATAYSTALRSPDATADRKQAAEGALIGVYARHVSGRLGTASSSLTGDMRTRADALAAPLTEHPETATLDQLRFARAGTEVLESRTRHFGRAFNPSAPVRTGADAIYGRALDSLQSGGSVDIAMAQSSLAERYVQTGDETRRTRLEGLSGRLAQNPRELSSVMFYIDADARSQEIRDALPSLPAAARAQGQRLLEGLDAMMATIASGQPLVDDGRVLQAKTEMLARMERDAGFSQQIEQTARVLMMQTPGMTRDQALTEIARAQATEAEMRRGEEMLTTLSTMTDLVRSARGNPARQAEIAEIFSVGVDALLARNTARAATIRQTAALYPRFATDADRRSVLAAVRGLRDGTVQEENFGAYMQVQSQRAEFESSITDPALKRNFRAYMDLAALAALRGDRLERESVLDLAVMYARWASVPANQGGVALMEARSRGMEFVQQRLGDYRRNPDILAGRRLIDAGQARSWTPRAGTITAENAPLTAAILGEGSISEAVGGGDRVAGVSALTALRRDTYTHLAASEDADWERSLARLEGRTPAEQSAVERRWTREAARLRREAASARARGQEALAVHYERQAELVDPQFMHEAFTVARSAYAEYRTEERAAIAFSDEADRARDADITNVTTLATRTREMIGEMPEAQRAEYEARLRQAGTDQAALRTLYLDVMRVRSEQLINGLPEGLQATARQRLRDAGSDEAGMRNVYVSLLRTHAGMHAARGEELRTAAMRIRDDMASLDRGVRLTTVHRTSGRFQLAVSIRTSMAVAGGYDCDFLGRPIEREETTPGGETRRVRVPLTRPRAAQLTAQASAASRVGRGAVDFQVAIERRRDRANAVERAQLTQDIGRFKTLLTTMIDSLPEGNRQQYRDLMTQAGDDPAMLQEIFRRLGNEGVRTQDDQGHEYADIEDRAGDARRAIGLRYAERFGAADALSSSSRSDFRGGVLQARNWLSDQAVARLYNSSTGTQIIGVGTLDLSYTSAETGQPVTVQVTNITPSSELIDNMIQKLPPSSEREALRQRLLAMPAGPAGNDQRQALFSSLLDREVYDPRRAPGTGVTFRAVIERGDSFYYHASEYDQQIAEARALGRSGRGSEAQAALDRIEGDMGRSEIASRSDARELGARHTAWETRRREEGLRGRYTEGLPNQEEHPRSYGEAQDRNDAVTGDHVRLRDGSRTSLLGLYEGSMERGAADMDRLADRHGGVRDTILAGGQMLQPTVEVAVALAAALADSPRDHTLANGRTYAQMLNDLTLPGSPQEQAQRAAALYQAIMDNPQDFAAAARIIREGHDDRGYTYVSGLSSDLVTQLDVTADEMATYGRQRERERTWAFADTHLRRGQSEHRLGDSSHRYRRATSERHREDEARLGWAPHYQTAETHWENAAREYEMAATMLLEGNDTRFTDIVVRNEPVTAPMFEFRGRAAREWHYDGPAYVTVYSENRGTFGTLGRLQPRVLNIPEEMYSLTRREAREMASYTDDDIRGEARQKYDQMGISRVRLELATYGIGTRWHEEEGGGYWGLYRTNMTPEAQRLANEAFQHGEALWDQVSGRIFAHSSDWGDDYVMGFLNRTADRFASDLSAMAAAEGENLAGAREDLRLSVPFEVRSGRLYDPDTITRSNLSDMQYWQGVQETVEIGGRIIVGGLSIALAPVTGGASLVGVVLLGAEQVGQGFEMRAQEGRWTGRAVFTVVMGGVSMVLPFTVYLAEASQVAQAVNLVARGATEAEIALAGATMTSRLVQAGGLLYMGVGMGDYLINQLPGEIDAVQRGDRLWWQAAAGGLFQTIQLAQVGISTYRGAQVQRQGGIPVYRSWGRQVFEALTMGEAFYTREQMSAARAYRTMTTELGALPAPARASYEAYRTALGERGIQLPPADQARLLTGYREAVGRDSTMTFERYVQTPEYRAGVHEQAYNAFGEGRVGAHQLNDEEFTYMWERSHGSRDSAQAEANVATVRGNERMQAGEAALRDVFQGNRTRASLDPHERAYVESRLQGRPPTEALAAADAAAPPTRAGDMRARGEEAARTREFTQAKDLYEGEMIPIIPGGAEETTYSHPSEPGVQYPRDQMQAARDIAATAEFMIRNGNRLPPGIAADSPVAARARELAGTPESPTAFRQFAERPAEQGGPNRGAQMRLALEQSDRMPQFAENAVDHGIASTMEGAASARDLNQAESGSATVRALSLGEGYGEFTRGTLTEQRARELGIGPDEMALFQRMRGENASPRQAGAEFARRAAAETSERALGDAVHTEFNQRAGTLAEPARGAAAVRAERLTEAYHDYNEINLSNLGAPERAARINEVRTRLGLSDAEHGFLTARLGLERAEVGQDIARAALGEIPLERPAAAPRGEEGRTGPRPEEAPPVSRTAAMEAEVGNIRGSEALEAGLRGASAEVVRIARVLEAMAPGDTVLSQQRLGELAAEHPEYASHIEAYNNARPEERPFLARRYAEEIAFGRSSRAFESVAGQRVTGRQASVEIVEDARLFHRALNGRDMTPAEMSRITTEHFDRFERLRRAGMGEADAILQVGREMRTERLMSERGMNRDQATRFVNDEAARPHDVPLRPEEGLGEQDFRAMPSEYNTRTITLPDGSTTTLADAQRARLIRRIDNTEDSVGSTAGVWVAEIMVNGQPRTVAVKVFKDPYVPGGQQRTAQHWENLFEFVTGHPARAGEHAEMGEAGNLSAISGMTFRSGDGRELPVGPGFYGFVNVDGNIAVAMDLLPGMYIGDMSPTQIREFVRPDTYAQIQRIGETLQANGYGMHDFQFIVMFPPESAIPTGLTGAARRQFIENWRTTINGREVRAGDVVLMDAGGLYRAADEPMSTFSPIREAERARSTADQVLVNDALARTTATAADANAPGRAQAQADLQVMEGFMREVEPMVNARDPMAEVTRRYMIKSDRADAAAARLEQIRASDPARAEAIEGAFRRFEREAGLPEGSMLPMRAEEAATVPRRAAVGAEETTVIEPTRPSRAPTPPPGEGTVPGRGRRGPPPTEERTTAPTRRQPPPEERTGTPTRREQPPGEGTRPERRGAPGERPAEGPPAAEVTAAPRSLLDDIRGGAGLRDAIDNLFGVDSNLARRLERRLEVLEQDPMFAERFRVATPEERAIIVESLASGMSPAEAFRRMAAEGAPRTAAEFTAYADRLAGMSEPERLLRIQDIANSDPRLGEALLRMNRETNPARRARLATEWEGAVHERARVQEAQEARAARTADDLRTQELDMVTRAAQARGLDTSIMTELYSNGGTEGRMAVLEGLGVDMSRFNAERTRIEAMPPGDARNTAQQRLDTMVHGFFELMTRGGLEGHIAAMPGYEGATVTGVEFRGGMRGVYEVTLSNGRRVFVKSEDVAPARLGRDLAVAEGMWTSRIHEGYSYDTGLTYRDGTPVRQEFGILEDIHDVRGTQITIRLPDGSTEQVRVVGVSMLRDEVLNVPQPPPPDASPEVVRAYEQRLAAFLADPVVQEFYRLSGSEGGRDSIFQAWRAYQEMSRRAVLGDRFARNTAAVIVERADGSRVLTFQPIDMDAVGWRVGSRPDGTPGFTGLRTDFAEANVDFLTKFSSATAAASGHGLIGGRVDGGTLLGNMYSPTAERGAAIPPDSPATRQRVGEILDGHDGRYFGAGFDTTSPDMPAVGEFISHGGSDRPIGRSDGRVVLHADDMRGVTDAAATPAERQAFDQAVRDELTRRFGGGGRPPGGGGGEPPPGPRTTPERRGGRPPGEGQPPGERTTPGRRGAAQQEQRAEERTMTVRDSDIVEERTATGARRGRAAEERTIPVTTDMIVEERTVPRAPPVEERTTPQRGGAEQPQEATVPRPAEAQPAVAPAPVTRMSPVDLVQPDNLGAFAGRLNAGDATAAADLAAMPPQVREQVGIFQERYAAAAGNAQEQTRIATEYAGRILASSLASSPETLWRFASNFRFGLESSQVTPQARAMLDSLPPAVRDLVIEFGGRLYREWSHRDALAPGYADRMTRAVDAAAVADMYALHTQGRPPANPADRAAMEFITAGGTRTIDPSTPAGAREIDAAVQFRRSASRLVERDGAAALESARTLGESVRTGARPADFQGALAYDAVQDLARASAQQAGRAVPGAQDYFNAAATFRLFEQGGLPDTATVRTPHFSGGNEALEQHGTAYIDWGGLQVEVHIFRDRVNVFSVEPAAIGEMGWPTSGMREALARYAQRRLRGPLERAFRGTMRQIPRETGGGYDVWRPVMDSIQATTLDLTQGRLATAPPAVARYTPEEIVRVHRTADVAARGEAAAAFLEMSPQDQQRTLGLLRERARPLEERAAALEAEARRLEAQVMPEYNSILERKAAAEAEATNYQEQVRALDPQIRAAEQRGDMAEVSRLRAERGRLDGLADERSTAARMLEGEAGRLMRRANDLREQAGELRAMAGYWNEQGMYFRELAGLGGEIGTYLSQRYGVPREELARAYSAQPTTAEARRALYDALGIRLGELPDAAVRSDAYRSFTSLADDPYIAGMILTGDLLRNVEGIVRPDIDPTSLQPGDRVVVRGIDFQNGLVGAYRLTIEVVDSQGRPRTFRDVSGRERTSMTLFAKRQGLSPDATGSEGGRLTGAPSPDILTRGADGRALVYVSPEGQRIEYGLMRDIRDFHGQIDAGRALTDSQGRPARVDVSVDAAEDLYSIVFSSGNPRTTEARDQLFGEFRDHPEQFLEALGYAQTGFTAAGFYDRHEGNVWAMWLRIRNQPAAEAAHIAHQLESQGYRVRDNGDGTWSFLRFGAIDSDTFGQYRAFSMPDGQISLAPMRDQLVTDLHRVFVHLTYEMNQAEIARAHAEGRPPRLRTVEEVTTMAFGENMDGPWMRGMRRWVSEFAPDTPAGARFRADMHSLFDGYNGQRSGMGFAMEGAQLGRFEAQGYEEIPSALNGMPTTHLDGIDGRTSFMANGRMATNPSISEAASPRVRAALPDGQDRYLVRIDDMGRSERRQFLSSLEASGVSTARLRTSAVGGREYIVFSDSAAIPQAMYGRTVAVRRDGDRVFVNNYGALLTAIPEGRAAYVVPLAGMGRVEARRLSSAPGARVLELSIGGEQRFVVFDSPQAVPERHRDSAMQVRRSGSTILGDARMRESMGIINTRDIGAAPMFDGMMNMGDAGWTGLWQGVRDGVLRAEAGARAAPDAGFLQRRVPNPGDTQALPPEYGGPGRTIPVSESDLIPQGSPPRPPPQPPAGGGGTRRGVAPPAEEGQPQPARRQPPPPPQPSEGRGTVRMAPLPPADQMAMPGPAQVPREGGTPGERADAAQMAGRLIAGDPNARTQFTGSSQGMQDAVGFELAQQLNLTRPGDIANFARDVALYELHRTGERPITDPAVLARVERNASLHALLPERVRTAVSGLAGNSAFILSARGTDRAFERYVGNRRLGGALVGGAQREIAGAVNAHFAAGQGAGPRIQIPQQELARISADLDAAVRTGQPTGSVVAITAFAEQGVYRVIIERADGTRTPFIYRERPFRQEAFGSELYAAAGQQAPHFIRLGEGPDARALQEVVGEMDFRTALAQGNLTEAERQSLFREAGRLGMIDYALGLPDSHAGNYVVVRGEGGTLSLMRIDFENAGIGWGRGIRPDGSVGNRDHVIFFKMITREIKRGTYTPGDIAAFFEGIREGAAEVGRMDADALTAVAGRYAGTVLSRDAQGTATFTVDQALIDAMGARIRGIQGDPVAARVQMLEYIFVPLREALGRGNAEAIAEIVGVLRTEIHDVPTDVLQRWKINFQGLLQSARTEEIRTGLRGVLGVVDEELGRRGPT
ncbi:MAG: hypothetical protein AB1529_04980 [Candidatus Micrarchaeota archaeon]